MTDRPDVLLHEFVQQGFAALHAGDREAAADICRRALEQQPGLARAHYLAALIALDSEDMASAVRALERSVVLNPRHAAAWAQLARTRLLQGAFVKAEECLKNAVRLERGNPATLDLIGSVFRLAGNLAASRDWHRRAVAAAPSDIALRVNLANSHLYFGAREAAAELLRDCLADAPHNPQLHWLLAAAVPAADHSHIETMRALLADTSHPRAIAYLQYAIGKEAEDLECWTEAFAAFTAGATARRRTVAYDEAAESTVYDTARRAFAHDRFDAVDLGLADAAPVFILGEPRTGSTLLDGLLSAHDRVHSAGELRHFGFAVRRATGLDEPRQYSPELLRAAAAAEPAAVARAYLDSTASLRGGAAHFIDKLPGNFLYLPLILTALPKARVVLIEREAMDNCLAMYKQLFADAYLFSYTQEETARHHLRYRELAGDWKARYGNRILPVSYEALVGDTENTMRRVLDYIGLSWQAQCLDPAQRGEGVATASAAQARERPHGRSVGRWRRYAVELAPMQRILAERDS